MPLAFIRMGQPGHAKFVTMIRGFISHGDDLMKATITVAQAKRIATQMFGCRGFCFTGVDTGQAVEVRFKSKFDNHQSMTEVWTSYKIQSEESVTALESQTAEKVMLLKEKEKPNGTIEAAGSICDPEPTAEMLHDKFEQLHGFISKGGDLLKETLTLEAAMKKALTLTGCRGFCFKGKDATEPVEVFFKNNDDVRELCGTSWESYLLQGVASQDESDKLLHEKFEEAPSRASPTTVKQIAARIEARISDQATLGPYHAGRGQDQCQRE